MPEPLRYRIEIPDAGMPKMAASTSMPMPSYGQRRTALSILVHLSKLIETTSSLMRPEFKRSIQEF